MKVVFLDFDGVIVPFGKASLADKAIKEAVKNFNSFLNKESDLKIVISSTWRRHGMAYCKRYLEGLGIDADRVIGMTDFERADRGHQIQCYLNRNPDIKHFVILDDHSDMPNLLTKLVKTSSLVGFTKTDAEKASEILNK